MQCCLIVMITIMMSIPCWWSLGLDEGWWSNRLYEACSPNESLDNKKFLLYASFFSIRNIWETRTFDCWYHLQTIIIIFFAPHLSKHSPMWGISIASHIDWKFYFFNEINCSTRKNIKHNDISHWCHNNSWPFGPN